jgi:cupin 2 domain-containing protein
MSDPRPSVPRSGNLFSEAEPPETGERFDVLVHAGPLVVERIVSSADAPVTDYDQDHDEWVALLRGSAVLDVEGRRVELTAGDWLWLPAGTAHTVCETSDGALWLAVHSHLHT